MKIVFISSWFSEKMGYSENFFPKAFAQLGHDVHLVTSTAQVYYHLPLYEKTYAKHLGPTIVPAGVHQVDGFTVHRLPFVHIRRSKIIPFAMFGITILGLEEYLEKINPDIIQVFNIDEPATLSAAHYAKRSGACFFIESHIHASVIRKNDKKGWFEILVSFMNNFRPSLSLINKTAKLCYPIAQDVEEICASMYKVPKDKMKLQSLGVDADLFSPAKTEEEKKERRELRQSLNIQDDELVCIYTGRFSPGKNPQCLADAVHILQVKGERVRGLFLGNGTEREIEAIISKKGCIVHPFVGVRELPLFYRAADIGVWPQEESTSQLDAAACGLPLILSDHIQVKERIEGNGYLYEHANPNDLAEKILLLKDSVLREKFSKRGIEKVKKQFSWLKLAKDRLEDYRQYCPKN